MQKATHTHHTSSHSDHLNVSEGRFQEFISEYGRKVVYLILTLIVLFLLMFRMSSGSTAGALNDYMNADVEFAHFKEASLAEGLAPNGPLTNLQEILKRRPELHAKYDGLLAQILLAKGDPRLASDFANLAFARVSRDDLPLYTQYAQTTLLIADNRYKEALERSQDLKSQMSALVAASSGSGATPQFGSILEMYNLIRIAFLQQQLGASAEELNAWKEVLSKSQMQETEAAPQALNAISSHFEAGNISLVSYIKERMKKLETD